MPATVVLLRHGQASFGSADYDVLSDLGRLQAARLGAILKARYPGAAAALSGTMRRQRDTARAALDAMGLGTALGSDAAWNEFDHHDVLRAYEPRLAGEADIHRVFGPHGAGAEAFERTFLAAVARWTSGAHDADYRETWAGFLARVDGALARAVSPLVGAGGGTLFVFTSGGPISAACRAALGTPDATGVLANAFRLANASVTELAADGDGLAVRAFNDASHFSGPDAGLLTLR